MIRIIAIFLAVSRVYKLNIEKARKPSIKQGLRAFCLKRKMQLVDEKLTANFDITCPYKMR